MSSSCPACQGHCTFFASATVLGKHEAAYLRCANCGSIHIPEPHWLDEAYTEAIASTDIGLAARAIDLSQIISLVITMFFRDARRFLDYAGGNGLLVRLMRDRGYRFTWNDPFATNLFARPFEGSLEATYDVVTAIEVLEHLTQPHDTLGELCALAPTIIATTEVLPEPAPHPKDWWYYSLGSGQHVTFYTQRGLDSLAARHGRRVSSGGNVHVFADATLSPLLLRLATSGQVARSLTRLSRRPSLLPEDYQSLTGQLPN
ncbi:MAG TPA: class I SAM-dependent methyltransferase [Acidimicrobiales bacterium]|nr:class I SAM-dependent methyltransferase [Acidimicrobiales bacterium]